MPKLTFLGAAGTVTGSKYLVEAAGKKLLLDCGIFQGSPELQDRNYDPLAVDPKTIDYCVLTHAHLDHTGWLPRFVKSGFHGPIFANPATLELTSLLLKDSARTGPFEVSPEFHFVAYDAGHILGSTSLELTITENGKQYVVVFSGDVGRYDQPILKDPATPPSHCDLLLCASTYGDRDHAPGDPAQTLADVINRVAGRGGSIIIPAFAIGRT